MTIFLVHHIPLEQLLFVHAPLIDVEWPGTTDLIHATIRPGAPFILAHIASGKTLLERIEERSRFPDKHRHWCTSDFKRGPIERELRRYVVLPRTIATTDAPHRQTSRPQ